MFALEVEFLGDRYTATRYNDRDAGEWPPHPARLFYALVATWSDLEDPHPATLEALEWLERQPAPALRVPEAWPRTVCKVFVPVNDTTALGGSTFRQEEALLEALDDLARAGTEVKALAKATKAVEKARAALSKAGQTLLKEAGGGTPKQASNARTLLPEHRTRKDRTFPTHVLSLGAATVQFLWPEAEPTKPQHEALRGLCLQVVRLGHSSSLVRVALVDEPGEPNWLPVEDGEEILRVPMAGQLRRLQQEHPLHRETLPRVLPCAFQAYRLQDRPVPRAPARPPLSDDWIVFARTGGCSLPIVRTVDLAEALRGALLSHCPKPISEVLSGHTADGRATERPHAAFVPLPFVGHEHATGMLLGAALVLPRDVADEDRRQVMEAIMRWEEASDPEEGEVRLVMGRLGVLQARRVLGEARSATLRPDTWCRPSRVWVTATPMALDRHPGDLYSHGGAKAARAEQEARQTLVAACRRTGLPDPLEAEILRGGSLVGSRLARDYPAYPARASGRPRRYLAHVRLVFEARVRGPILLGSGRYRGLGLFRPWREDA